MGVVGVALDLLHERVVAVAAHDLSTFAVDDLRHCSSSAVTWELLTARVSAEMVVVTLDEPWRPGSISAASSPPRSTVRGSRALSAGAQGACSSPLSSSPPPPPGRAASSPAPP